MKDSNQRHRPDRRPGSRRPQKSGRLAAEFPHQYRSAVSLQGKSEEVVQASEVKPRAPRTTGERVKLYLPLVLICNSFGLIAALAVALFLVVGGFTDIKTLPTSISVGWSVLNLIPLHASGITFGFLPILPALCFCAVMAWRYRQAIKHRVSVKDLQVLLVLVMLVPLAISAVAHIILGVYGSSEAITWSSWWEIVLRVLVLHWFALALAIPMKIWRALLKKAGLDLRISTAFLRAWRFLSYVALGGALLYIGMLASQFSEFKEALTIHTGTSDYMGVIALLAIALAYLPNAVVGVAGVLVGSIFHLGETSLSLMAIAYGPIPVFPVLAVLPEQEATWMIVLFAVPVAAAMFVYIKKTPQLLDTVETALAGAVLAFIFAFSNSGSLGVYGATGLSLGLTSLVTGAWLLVSGLIVWLVGRWAISHGKLIEVEVPAPEISVPQGKNTKAKSQAKQKRSSQGPVHSVNSVRSAQKDQVKQNEENHRGKGLPIKSPQNSQSTSQIASENGNTPDTEVDTPAEETEGS